MRMPLPITLPMVSPAGVAAAVVRQGHLWLRLAVADLRLWLVVGRDCRAFACAAERAPAEKELCYCPQTCRTTADYEDMVCEVILRYAEGW